MVSTLFKGAFLSEKRDQLSWQAYAGAFVGGTITGVMAANGGAIIAGSVGSAVGNAVETILTDGTISPTSIVVSGFLGGIGGSVSEIAKPSGPMAGQLLIGLFGNTANSLFSAIANPPCQNK